MIGYLFGEFGRNLGDDLPVHGHWFRVWGMGIGVCTGGPDVIRKEAWPFCRISSGVRLWWELKEPQGPKGLGFGVSASWDPSPCTLVIFPQPQTANPRPQVPRGASAAWPSFRVQAELHPATVCPAAASFDDVDACAQRGRCRLVTEGSHC
ncbi:hypothetical protein T484DRAFT_3536383 [Baffinella frigidus]|nr:hypothetical protein T484DRAFT_3536383 [Cryptophyta sp. CCMP2293]